MANAVRAALIVLLWISASPARAADRYICDCVTPAAGCVAGNDANEGTSPAAPVRSYVRAQAIIPALQGSERLLWCRGGSWSSDAGIAVSNSHATAATPVTVLDAYTPASGATAPPRLSLTGTDQKLNLNLFAFFDDGAGFRFRNAVLAGTGVFPQRGIFIAGNVADVTVENLTIDGFYGNIQCATAPNDPSKRLTIRNNIIRNAMGMGVLSGCGYGLIENNRFDNNGREGTVGVHHIYLDGEAHAADPAKRVHGNVVRGNTLVNNTITPLGTCGSTNIVVHNTHYDLTIDRNVILMADGQGLDLPAHPTWGNGCYGIGVSEGNLNDESEGYVNVRVSNNTIVNFGGSAIQLSQCRSCIVENNVLVQNQYVESRAIQIGGVGQSANDLVQNANVVRHNTLYFAQAAKDTVGIDFSGSAAGIQHEVANNLVLFGATDASNYACFRTAITGAAMAFWDNNLCDWSGTAGKWATSHDTRTAFAAAYGFDAHSLSGVDPLLPAPTSPAWDCTVRAGSPAIDHGSVAHGNTKARGGNARTGVPDIGACERDTLFADGFQGL